MKRLLLLTLLLVSASAASAESISLKCAFRFPHADGYIATRFHEFEINPDEGSISWKDGYSPSRPAREGHLMPNIGPDGEKVYWGIFPGINVHGFMAQVSISRVDGRYALGRDYGKGLRWAYGKCSKAPGLLF